VRLSSAVLTMVEPRVAHSVGLAAVDREPVSPLVLAAFECAKTIEPPAVSDIAPVKSGST
jgi:hypothetical protein